MGAMQSRTDNSNLPFILSGESYANENGVIKQDGARAAVLYAKTVMGKRRFSLATIGIKNAGNTGNGTVSAVAKLADGKNLIPGNYNLEATAVGTSGRVLGATTPAGTNTGAGLVSALAIKAGVTPKVGDFLLTCKDIVSNAIAVGATIPAGTNTGAGLVSALAIKAGVTPKVGDFLLICTDPNANGAKSATSVKTGIGDGVMGAITPGAQAIEGDYIATCIDASVSGSEIFSVFDPNGVRLEDMTVGVAYLNNHLGFTQADGAADFIVGDYITITVVIAHGSQFTLTDPDGVDIKTDIVLPGTPGGHVDVDAGGITFTLTDDTPDFIAGDYFTLGIITAHGGRFTLTDPDGVDIKTDIVLPGTPGGHVDVDAGGITFTLTDDTPDFIAGDYFTLEITSGQGGVFKLEDPHGNLISSNLEMSGDPLGSTTFNSGGMTFTVTDGSTDFIVGDKFNITVTADSDYVPLKQTDLLGGANFAGIYIGENVTAAAIVAGDVVNCPMITGGKMTIDGDQLIFENGLSLTSVLPSGKTVREEMEALGIFVESTIAVDEYENT
jgi:hypothetical protein